MNAKKPVIIQKKLQTIKWKCQKEINRNKVKNDETFYRI